MRSRLIIDGNAVYEIDEDCMLRKNMENTTEKGGKEKGDMEREPEEKTEKGT